MSMWYQQSLTPPEVYECTLKVGVIPSQDHVQTWWEVKDPTTGVLIAAGAHHHTTYSVAKAAVEHALRNMLAHLDSTVSPF